MAPQPNIAVGFSSALHANEAVDERLRTKLSRVVLPPLIARLLCRINDGVRQPEPRHALPAIHHHHAATASRQRAIGSGDCWVFLARLRALLLPIRCKAAASTVFEKRGQNADRGQSASADAARPPEHSLSRRPRLFPCARDRSAPFLFTSLLLSSLSYSSVPFLVSKSVSSPLCVCFIRFAPIFL